jgi:hypothetical protein
MHLGIAFGIIANSTISSLTALKRLLAPEELNYREGKSNVSLLLGL